MTDADSSPAATTPPTPTRKDLYDSLSQVSLSQERRFRRRLKKARAPKALGAIANDIESAAHEVAQIGAAIPDVTYPEALPVTARKDDIAHAIEDNQVVVIAGETGSGKTTQIPKICLDLGRGRRGFIGHTQPRRIAARTVAERIADELGQDVGESVGYAIRFDDKVGRKTAVKLMTDGVLLAEMQRDRDLLAYDTIILDEAHERSLNIDFLLGYLKRLLPRRPDLKVIITSATIDPERFAEHFADEDGNPTPIIEVSGRTYPVEIRYRPLEIEVDGKAIDRDVNDGLVAAVEELMLEGPGDILCFFPGERDIRDAMDALEARKFSGVEIVPLFGRLSNQEQHKVFGPHSSRRIVLATNIAETSLTVPGIHYVIDTGTARISRYSTRTKVQRLPIEPISQASAKQRSGRSGRTADGIAIRLYSEEDFLSRPEFTDPEIVRTNLASVILQMASLKLGDIADFPFVQPPDPKAVRDGMALLKEISAISEDAHETGEPTLTKTGQDIARIPLDPRLARMLVEARRLGCVDDVIVIVAGLTVQDIRERPMDKQAQADQLHARFKDTKSDFVGYLNLWDYLNDLRQELSGNAYRRRLKAEYLHYMRSREWRSLVKQLGDVVAQLKWNHGQVVAGERDRDAIHQALLSGLLMQIGARDGKSKEFQGTRGTRFMVFPGSAVSKKPPEFIMAAELVETSRLWARDVAAIEPSWVEKLGRHLVKYQYSEPHWSRKKGAAMAYEKASLYGVTISADRLVPYHRVDPEAAREIFLREALVEGDWDTHHKFFATNKQILSEASEIEEKARRRGLILDSDALFDFYDARVPKEVSNAASFNAWWKKESKEQPELLVFNPDDMVVDGERGITGEDFPDEMIFGDTGFALTYRFEPGAVDDGVSLHVPLPMLDSIDTDDCAWLVPGLRQELFTELIRSLPKGLRKSVVPAPDFATKALEEADPSQGSVTEVLAKRLASLGGSGIDAMDFQPESLPSHLKMTYKAINRRGKVVDEDKDLDALRSRQAGHISSSVKKLSSKQQHGPVKSWTAETLGDIAEETTASVDGHTVVAYPALSMEKNGIAVTVYSTRAEAEQSMFTATLTMLMRDHPVKAHQLLKGLPLQQRVAVDSYAHGGAAGLVEQLRVAALRDLLRAKGGPARSPEAYAELSKKIGGELPGLVQRAVRALGPALVRHDALTAELSQWEGPAIDDMRAELEMLFPQEGLIRHDTARLGHLARYLQAMQIRLEEMQTNPDRDAERQSVVDHVNAALNKKLSAMKPENRGNRAVANVRWMIEELRVSLFAQRLGTAQTVSEKRVAKAIAAL